MDKYHGGHMYTCNNIQTFLNYTDTEKHIKLAEPPCTLCTIYKHTISTDLITE